jgi:4-hydroxythreonine-4-phosphate dehydrogenase
MGDPAGVGPELCLRLLVNDDLATMAVPLVFGDLGVLCAAARACGLPVPDRSISLKEFEEGPERPTAPCVVSMGELSPGSFEPGAIHAACGLAAFTYFTAAIDAALEGFVDAIVSAPIHKEALAAAGVRHPGHTEVLAEWTGAERHVMMLTAPEITCALVTAHVGLRDVPGLLTPERVLDTIELTAEAMRRMRGREPRLTVCGLNPHAGEHGLFGDKEEERAIVPAIEAARERGIDVRGPLSPDTAFLPKIRSSTDAYVCMYHDQGLVPLKMLAFDEAVNVTLGLPVVRTSVDHGTAFDIAWKGLASPNSLFEAFRLAVLLTTSRPSPR